MHTTRARPRPHRVSIFGPRALATECQAVGSDLGAEFTWHRDLQAACRALAQARVDTLVLSIQLPFWDREVAEEHARRHAVPVRPFDPDGVGDLRTQLLAWTRRQ